MTTNTEALWPALPYEEWKDTYATLHMWMQVVGKIALALAPPLNHCWAVTLHVTARGLATRMLAHGDRSFTIRFDFIAHQLVIETTDGEARSLALEPRTVADFYHELMAVLRGMGLPVKIWPVAVELPEPIRLDEDTKDHVYDAGYANRFWRILVEIERVFTASQCAFVGKSSPVHFFWGSFDFAVTRFSGRHAPPREGPAFARDAYSHEVISHGFWPGSGPLLEPAFYAYAAPAPAGLKDAHVEPEAAYYHPELGEFILPYDAVRRADSPERMLRGFIDSTYARAADLAKWDRAALDRTPPA
ncbi:MAG: DUF5996 family protein [Gammaproteobacteria bacterium]